MEDFYLSIFCPYKHVPDSKTDDKTQKPTWRHSKNWMKALSIVRRFFFSDCWRFNAEKM